ncbi:MAG: hypothetical protein JW900_04410 [Anaerolineae bacterium]|nr:hypothetical protein [Anaerolineae bacterium]
MIPLLLWRCPLCAANDALVHVARRFRADRVYCRACRAEWRLRRVPGDNFYLRLVGTRDERSVTAWYDAMKATLCLEPLHDPAAALEAGEALYLASGPAALQAEATDPLFFTAPEPRHKAAKSQIEGRSVGRGRLFLTDRRLTWLGEENTASWSLARLNSAYAAMDIGLALMVERRLYTVHFFEESLLKWVTYVALVAPLVEAKTGHRIETSHF